jgi:class I fructose-bisphosphate aldolase
MKNRYWKFFKSDERALIMAFDHGLQGNIWINPGEVIAEAVKGGIDGLLTSAGVLKNFSREIGNVGTILRLEAFGSALNKNRAPIGTPFDIEDAIRLGADGVMLMGFPGEDDAAGMQFIAKAAAAADKWGIISAAEMLPNGFSSNPDDRTIEKMNIACRIAVELGIDFVKTQFVEPADDFKKVVDNCYRPILVLGGAKIDDDRDVLTNARLAMDAGCKGLVIGRNVWGHKNISGMASALRKIVHENADVDVALKELE